ncbi:MAG: FG-GAP-like repeat-containing protein [Luteolibacter sp.]
MAPYNVIQFHYAKRNDKVFAHFAGGKLRTIKRLTDITVGSANSNGDLSQSLYSYHFEYLDENESVYPGGWSSYIAAHEAGLSILSRVSKVNGQTGESLPPLEFTWSDLGGSGLQEGNGIETLVGDNYEASKTDINRIKFADFDGDGIKDIYYINGFGSYENDTIHLGCGSGSYESCPGIPSISTSVQGDHEIAQFDVERLKFIDLNGDGRTDIYEIRGWGATKVHTDRIHISNGRNANGDITFNTQNGIFSYIGGDIASANTDASRINFTDFNGDGLIDIYYVNGFDSSEPDNIYIANIEEGHISYETLTTGFETPVGSDHERASFDISRLKFLDINGDGRTDIYEIRGWGNSIPDLIRLSTGEVVDGQLRFILKGGINSYIGDNIDAALTDSSRINFGEFNGDGLADIYYVNGFDAGNSTTQDTLWLNEANGSFRDYPALVGVDSSVANDHERALMDINRLKFIDMNSDGLTDIYYVRGLDGGGQGSKDHIYTSRGNGTFQFRNKGFNSFVGSSIEAGKVDIDRIKFADFNGDGLIDLYYIKPNNSPDELKLGNTDGYFRDVEDGLNNPHTVTVNYHEGAEIDINRLKFIDLDGDGMTDIYNVKGFHGTAHEVDEVWRSRAKIPHIERFTDGLGAEILVEYQRMWEPNSTSRVANWGGPEAWKTETYIKGTDTHADVSNRVKRIKDGRLLVSRYAEEDGMGGLRWKRHHYAELKIDRENEVSLGFERITVIDETRWQKSESYYRQDFPFNGRLASSKGYYYNEGELFCISEEEHLYSQWTPRSAIDNANLKIRFIYSNQSISYAFDVAGKRISATFLQQDFPESQYGHLGTSTVLTIPYTGLTGISRSGASYSLAEVEASRSPGDWQKITTSNTYSHDVANWFLGRLSASSVSKTLTRADGSTDSSSKNSAFTYYTSTGLVHTDTVEPGTDLATTTSREYDSYGNVVKSTTTTFDGNGGQISRYSSSSYSGGTNGEQDGRFLIRSENQLGHSSSNSYDPARSLLLSTTGANGLTTKFLYDEWGTKTLTRTPDGLESAEITKWATDSDRPSGVTNGVAPFDTYPEIVFIRKAHSSGGAPGVVFIDSQGRQVMSCTRTLQSVSADGVPTYTTVYQRTAYDSRGRMFAESLPFFAGEEILFSRHEFDQFDRVLKTYYPDGTFNSLDYNHGGDSLAALATDQKGLQMIQKYNVLEQTVSNTNIGNGGGTADQIAEYSLDAEGRLVQADTVGNFAISTQYNNLGQNTGISDPDAGDSWTKHNGFGEVMEAGYGASESSGVKTSSSSYDVLGRKTSTTTYTASGAVEYHTVSTYDTGGWLGAVASTAHYKDGFPGDAGATLISSSVPSYDQLGRVTRVDSTVLGNNYTSSSTYDSLGRVYTETDVAGLTVMHQYTADSFEVGVINYHDGTVYHRPREFDSGGRVVQEQLGNGVIRNNGYERSNGRLESIESSHNGVVLQDLEYGWDSIANLRYRQNKLINRYEEFSYDQYSRLIGAEVSTGTHSHTSHTGLDTEPSLSGESYGYDSTGNLTQKPGITLGAGSYAGHRLTSYQRGAADFTLNYDSRGRVYEERKDGQLNRSFTWNSFSQLSAITKLDSMEMTEDGVPRLISSASASIEFGADFSRLQSVKTEYFTDGEERVTNTTYLGSVEKVSVHEYAGTTDLKMTETTKHYIGGLAIVEQVKDLLAAPNAPPAQTTKYLLGDHLGSTETVTDQDGAVVERVSYDAWGQQRDAVTWGEAESVDYGKGRTLASVTRGFTGHEQFDSLGITHMNGRIYDSVLGRFLSPDPVVQAPEEAQNYNAYSYVLNNPLSYTDPSGYIFSFIKKVIDAIIGIFEKASKLKTKWLNKAGKWLAKKGALEYVTTAITIIGFIVDSTVGFGFGSAAASGINTALAGGDNWDVTKGVVISYASYAATTSLHGLGKTAKAGGSAVSGGGAVANAANAIHNATNVSFKVLYVAAHGVLGGVKNVLLGGKFKDGFLSAAASTAFGAYVSYENIGLGSPGDYSKPYLVAARTSVAAVIGGTVSEVGGGKFANGAYTSAFQHLFNAEVVAVIVRANGHVELYDDETIREFTGFNSDEVLIEAAAGVGLTKLGGKLFSGLRARAAGLLKFGKLTVDPDNLKLTNTVANHLTDRITKGANAGLLSRPFLGSKSFAREIMKAGKPIPDPGGLAKGLRWDVSGSLRGSRGTFQLVVDTADNTIKHFNFVGSK